MLKECQSPRRTCSSQKEVGSLSPFAFTRPVSCQRLLFVREVSPKLIVVGLTGRFLHITDFHPDPHYKAGTTFDSGCHRKVKKKKGKSIFDDEDDEDKDMLNKSSSDVSEMKKKKGDDEEEDDDVALYWGSAVS